MNRPTYGITNRKKVALDALTRNVQNAESQSRQLQVILTAFTQRNAEFSEGLQTAEQTRTTALNNRNQVDHVVNQVWDLKCIVDVAQSQTHQANESIHQMTQSLTTIVDQLIFTVSVINRLAALVQQKKALNPLISDDLVSNVMTASTHAQNAVGGALNALESCYASQTAAEASVAVTDLEAKQVVDLYQTLIGQGHTPERSIQGLLNNAYETAKDQFQVALQAQERSTNQLNTAQANLNAAQFRLNSLRSGLSAASAAVRAT